MTKKEFDKKYVGENLVINCKSEELAIKFLKLANEFGYKWCTGQSYLCSNDWDRYKLDTCYKLYDGTYAGLKYYQELGYEIVEFKGENMEFKQEDLKTGMIVERRNGEKLMFLSTELGGLFISKDFDFVSIIENFIEFKHTQTKHNDIIKVFGLEKMSNVWKPNWGTTEILWEEKPKETTMTIKEIEERLGVSNLRITK